MKSLTNCIKESFNSLLYVTEIIKTANGYTVNCDGDSLWEDFNNIIKDLNNNNIDPSTVTVNYDGTFGENPNDEWCEGVADVANQVKTINIVAKLNSSEKRCINQVIRNYNLTNINV